jgi:cytosine deaminase
MGAVTLEAIARRTTTVGLGRRVNVSHAYALGDLAPDRLDSVAATLAEAGVSIMTNAPGRQAFPPVDTLLDAGVTVFGGSDNIRDPWWPFGDADQLERAMLVAYRMDWRTDAQLGTAVRLVSDLAATALGLDEYGLSIGAPADLVLVAAQTIAEAVVARPPREVIVQGRPLASMPQARELVALA